jgi:hypothetical protein
MSNESLVPVYEADSQAEAAIIEGILKENGIDCTVRTLGLAGVSSGGPATGNPIGESLQVLVRSSDSAKAEQTILDYHSPDDQYK